MATHDYNIANADGATVRADINSVLEAVATNNSSSTAPSITFPYMFWFDTSVTPGKLKQRNGANTAWIDFADDSEVTTSTGTQTLAGALDDRVVYVDTITNMLALSTTNMDEGQTFVVDGRLSFVHTSGVVECVYGEFIDVAEMKTAPVKEGATVSTLSYYSSDPKRGRGVYVAQSGLTADGFVTHDLPNGLVANLVSQVSVWNAGAQHFFNDGVNTGTDSTDAVQAAILFAKENALGDTHTLSKLTPVFCDNGDFLISGRLYIPEGVVLDGIDKISSRIVMGWTGTTTKVVPWGVKFDEDNTNPLGTTFTKNFGLKNTSFVPHYVESGPGSATIIDNVYGIELMLHEVRFVMHKGAVAGGQLNATALKMQKAIDTDILGVTFDGGANHISAQTALAWGARTTRGRGVFSFDVKDNAILLDDSSNDNDIQVVVQMPNQSGTNRGCFIVSGKGNKIDIHAQGAQLTSGVILDGQFNTASGYVRGASSVGLEMRGSNNHAAMTVENSLVVDNGTGSVIRTKNLSRDGGVSSLLNPNKTTSSVSTWQQAAQIEFESGAAHTAVVFASAQGEVAGIGRELITNRFLVSQNSSGTVSVATDTAFSNGTAIGLRVVSAGANLANVEVQFTSGTQFDYDLTVEMQSDGNAKIREI